MPLKLNVNGDYLEVYFHFTYVHAACMYVWLHMWVPSKATKRGLEIQAVVRCPVWVLGNKFRSSVEGPSALKSTEPALQPLPGDLNLKLLISVVCFLLFCF